MTMKSLPLALIFENSNSIKTLYLQKGWCGFSFYEIPECFSLFYNIILARELIKVREESITSLGDHLKTVQDRYDKGYSSQFDVLRAKVQLANAQPPLVQAKNLYQNATDNLKNLLGIDIKDRIAAAGFIVATALYSAGRDPHDPDNQFFIAAKG